MMGCTPAVLNNPRKVLEIWRFSPASLKFAAITIFSEILETKKLH